MKRQEIQDFNWNPSVSIQHYKTSGIRQTRLVNIANDYEYDGWDMADTLTKTSETLNCILANGVYACVSVVDECVLITMNRNRDI